MIAGDVNTHPQGDLDMRLFEEQRADPTKSMPFVRFAPSTLAYVDANSDDVLCGKDKATFEHEGNKRFREIILENASRYVFCDTQAERVTLVRRITDIVRNSGGRFIKKDEDSGRYYEINERMSREKVRQALRFAGISKEKKSKRSKATAAGKVFTEAKRHLRNAEAREYLEAHGWMKFLTSYIPEQKKVSNKKEGYDETTRQLSSQRSVNVEQKMEPNGASFPTTDQNGGMSAPLPSLENHHLSSQADSAYLAPTAPAAAFSSFTGAHPTMPPPLPTPMNQGPPHMAHSPHGLPNGDPTYGFSVDAHYPSNAATGQRYQV